MTVPDFVKAFWYAVMELGDRTERTPWGAIATDGRFPSVWEANTAAVLEPAPDLEADAIRSALLPALDQAGAPYEHVEFWDAAVDSPALGAYRRDGERADPDVTMVFQGPLPATSARAVRVAEVAHPGDAFWPWYRESLSEFGLELSTEVLDQMVRRTREVFLPAGLRWFVGGIDGEPAGYASLLSLGGVGYLDNVVTMPGFRRRGVAGATVASAVSASREAGDRHLFLLAEQNGDAQRLYERLGFRVTAKVESYTTRIPAEDPA